MNTEKTEEQKAKEAEELKRKKQEDIDAYWKWYEMELAKEQRRIPVERFYRTGLVVYRPRI